MLTEQSTTEQNDVEWALPAPNPVHLLLLAGGSPWEGEVCMIGTSAILRDRVRIQSWKVTEFFVFSGEPPKAMGWKEQAWAGVRLAGEALGCGNQDTGVGWPECQSAHCQVPGPASLRRGVLGPLFCRPCSSLEGGAAGPAGVSSTPGAGVPQTSLCPCPGKTSHGWLGTLGERERRKQAERGKNSPGPRARRSLLRSSRAGLEPESLRS